MAAIDIGAPAIDRSQYFLGDTVLSADNPANAAGVLTSLELWLYIAINAGTCKVGTFYGGGTSWTCRDYVTLGAIAAGSKQTISGLNIAVGINDLIGFYNSTGGIDTEATGGSGMYYYFGDNFPGANPYTFYSGYRSSVYGIGLQAATVTTQSATVITTSGCTGNGNITDTGGAGSDVTRRGFCYMVGTSGDPTTANSVAYDNGTFGTGVYTKAIAGLNAGTGYRVRAYVVNAAGTSYGTTVQVTTLSDFIPQIIIF